MKPFSIFMILQLLILNGYSQSVNSEIFTDSLYSNSLNESRGFCVYLPKSFQSRQKYPIIYCTDGQILIKEDYKAALDSLISSGAIEPVVLIGINSNEKELGRNTSFRQIEYLKGFQDDSLSNLRYKGHLHFFLKEAPDYILEKYNIQEDTTESSFYGFSNGGGFGMNLFFEMGDIFKNYICFSPLGAIAKKPSKGIAYQKLYISYGTEELFIMVDKYKELIAQLGKYKYGFISEPYPGGHDETEWKKKFIDMMVEIYHPKN